MSTKIGIRKSAAMFIRSDTSTTHAQKRILVQGDCNRLLHSVLFHDSTAFCTLVFVQIIIFKKETLTKTSCE